MSTAGGPKLAGIGRSGDSDIVLCMDAHDAGSYGGEATVNLFPQPSLASSAVGTTWSGANGTWGTSTATVESVMGPDGKYIKAVSNRHSASGGGTANIWFFYHYLSGMGSAQRDLTLTNGTTYTCSWWWKANESRTATSNNIYFIGYANVSTGGSNTVTTEWTKASISFTFGGTTGTYWPGHYFYSCGDDFKVWYAMLQIEEKTYATPTVRNQLSGFGQQGYNARPASINLMIHGNVGTGTTFKDSSPSKHTVSATGSMAHSSTQSKFSGGSIYFPSADYLTATSSDFAFGTIDWTIDFWVNQSTTLGWASPVDTYGVAGQGFILGFDASTNYLAFYSEPGVGWVNAYGSHAGTSFALTNGTWYHVAYVRNGNAFTCYVNGATYFTTTLSASDNYTSTGLYMGRRGNMNGSYEGYLDEIRITKGTALWTSAFTPPTRRNRSAPVVDLSGNHNGANLINGTDTDTSTYRAGEVIMPIDSAFWDFDGTDEHLTTPFGSGRNVYTNPVSVCAWVKADSATAAKMWLDVGSNGSNQRFYCALITASNPSIFGTQGNAWSYSAAADTSKWYHQALVMDNGTARAYYDGIAGGTRGFSSYTLPSYVRIGGRSGYEWDGQIAAVQIYDTILTPQQVKENFNSQRSRFKV